MNEMVWPSLISNKFLAPAFFNRFWFWLSLYNLKPMASLSDKLTKLIPGYHFHHFLTIWSKNTHTCPRSTIEDDNRVKSKIPKSLFDRNISVRDLWWENLTLFSILQLEFWNSEWKLLWLNSVYQSIFRSSTENNQGSKGKLW